MSPEEEGEKIEIVEEDRKPTRKRERRPPGRGLLRRIFWNDATRFPRVGRIFLLALFILVVGFFIVGGFVVVPAGHKGVVVTSPFGPDMNEIGEGWNWNPVYALSDVEIIRYNTQTRDMTGASGLTVRSSDNLDIKVDCSLIFRMPSDKVADIRIERGNYLDIVDRYVRNTPRNVASNYTGEYIGGEGRIAVEQEVLNQITSDLAAYDITVEDYLIRSVDLPETVDQAIEEKQAAEQKVVTAEYNRQAIVINAQAEASRLAIEAEGYKNATIIRANGTGEAIRIVMDQLITNDPNLTNITEAYLTMLYIQALTNPDSNIEYIIITDGGNPIIIQPKGG